MSLKLYNTSQGIYLSLLQLHDAEELLQLRLRNKVQHQPFEPLREDDYFTLESQKQLVGQRLEDARQDRAYMFGIFLLDGQLIGQVTISNVVRGVGQYADIGYFIDHEVQGKGYTSAAVGLILSMPSMLLGCIGYRLASCCITKAPAVYWRRTGFRQKELPGVSLKSTASGRTTAPTLF